ncbi:hypothetical protein AB1N83_007987 [Pleurotus pulmonarius]
MPPNSKDLRRIRDARCSNTITNSIRILRGIEGLSELPLATPLKPICTLAVSILELIQTLRSLRSDHADLVDRVAQLARILEPHPQKARCAIAEAGELERALHEILGALEGEYRLTWFQRVYKTQELRDNISACTAKLDTFIERFTIASLLRIQDILTEAHEEEIHIYKDSQIFLERSFRALPHSTLFRGRVIHSAQTDTDSRVVVQRYRRSAASHQVFRADIQRLRRLRHPNLHQLAGVSVATTELPFVVFPKYEAGNVMNYVNAKLKGSVVDSFMATLRICQGTASGVEFLRTECLELRRSELEACFDPSNIVLTPNGQAIIGHGLVLDMPEQVPSRPLLSLDAWLKHQCLNFVISMTYGRIDPSDWNTLMARNGGRHASHLRVLEHFTSYVVPNFAKTTILFDALLDALESAHRHDELTFPRIRAAVLGLWGGAFVYRPKTAIRCALGDVGYMRADGEFAVLMNAGDLVALGVDDEPPLILRSAGGDVVEGAPDGSGIIRHQFGETLFASIRRHRISEMIASIRGAWRYFIANATSICARFSTPELALKVPDLILIVGVDEDLRYSILDRKSNLDAIPHNVDFLEFVDPGSEGEWGEWETGDTGDAVITYIRCPQNLLFIQLEEEDIAPQDSVM